MSDLKHAKANDVSMRGIAVRAAYLAMICGITWAADRYPKSTTVALIAGWVLVGPPEKRADNNYSVKLDGDSE